MRNCVGRVGDTLQRIARWVVRFRKRKGYGVHSPFAFNFITNVIYEDGCFYAYKEFKDTYGLSVHRFCRLKDYQLLFRLANYQQAKVACMVGKTGDELLQKVLKKGCMQMSLCKTEFLESGKYDLIIAYDDWEHQADTLLNHLNNNGVLIVKGLDKNKKNFWQKLLQQPQAQVAFDLYDFGIVFYRPDLQRQHYVVNYF